jgi:hypothetical protein
VTDTGATVSGQLEQARDQLTEAEHILTDRPPELAALHAAVAAPCRSPPRWPTWSPP